MGIRVFLSAVFLISFIAIAILLGGPLTSFIDPVSLLIVFGCIATASTWSFSLEQLGQAFSVALQGKASTEQQAIQAHTVFVKMADFSFASGLLGTLIGLVNMLQNLDDPTAIGPAMAVALLTLFYGVLLGQFVLQPIANNCLSQHKVLEREAQRGFVALHFSLIGLLVVLASFFVMLLAMANFG